MQEQDFQQIAAADQDKQRQLKADDLQHEVAGQQTGRITRHLPSDQSPVAQQKKDEQEKRAQAMMILAMMLASNPEYAKLYRETMNLISNVEAATEQAIADTLERLRLAEAQLELAFHE